MQRGLHRRSPRILCRVLLAARRPRRTLFSGQGAFRRENTSRRACESRCSAWFRSHELRKTRGPGLREGYRARRMMWHSLASRVVRQWSWRSVLVQAACIPLLPPPPGGAVCKPACSRGLSGPRSPAAFRFPPDRQPLACPPRQGGRAGLADPGRWGAPRGSRRPTGGG
jgi:hypothetical protein